MDVRKKEKVMRTFLVFATSLLILCGACSKPKARRSHTEHPVVSVDAAAPPVAELTIPEEQLRVIREAHDALAQVASTSGKAQELLTLYNAFALPALYEQGNVRVVTAPTAGRPVFMIAANPTQLQVHGAGGTFAVFTCHPFPVMLIQRTDSNALIQGVMLAHELEHANDCLFNGEPDNAFLDDNWLTGELHAHTTVAQVLDEHSRGGWERIVSASRAHREELTLARGSRPESSLFGQLPEDRDAILQQFGALDDLSLGFLFAQLDIDAARMNARVQMAHYGRPPAELPMHELEIARHFYTQHQDAIQHQNR